MNDHNNEEMSLPSSGEQKTKTKGAGYLRSKSSKPKKVPSLFSPKDNLDNSEKNQPQQIINDSSLNTDKEIKNLNSIEHPNNTLKTSQNIDTNKKFEKPNPYKKINKNNIHKSEEEHDLAFQSSNPENANTSLQQDNEKTSSNNKTYNRSYKKPFKSKNPKQYRNEKISKDNTYSDDTLDISLEIVQERPVSDSLLSLIRQRTGFDTVSFWKELDSIQKSSNPIDFSKEISTFITSAVLFNKEDIYLELLEKYGQFLKLEDFEGNLIPYCANRPSYFLDKTIYFYDKLIGNKPLLTNLLINKLTNCSFREENNFIWLSWLDKNSTEEQMNHFFTYAFECHNIVVVLESLHFKNLSQYLRNNLEKFQQQIDACPQSYNILFSLKHPDYYIDRANKIYDKELEFSSKQFENSLQSQLQNKEKKIEKKEIKEEPVTEVIIKKKKTFDNLSTSTPSPFI